MYSWDEGLIQTNFHQMIRFFQHIDQECKFGALLDALGDHNAAHLEGEGLERSQGKVQDGLQSDVWCRAIQGQDRAWWDPLLDTLASLMKDLH